MNITLNEIAEKAAIGFAPIPDDHVKLVERITRALQEATEQERKQWIEINRQHEDAWSKELLRRDVYYKSKIAQLRQQLEATETALTYERGARENALLRLQQTEALLRQFTDECQKQGINLGPLVADARALIDQKGKK